MNNTHKKRVPNLAGICTTEEACRIGISVDKNVELLKRLNYIKTRLYEIMVKHMNRTPEWEVKGAMSLHIWLDADHAADLRKRVSEMREPPLHLDKVPDPKLEALMNEAICAETTIELLAGIYEVIRPALLAAYWRHIEMTNPLVDYPTARVLRHLRLEEEDMIAWGSEALEALVESEQDESERRAWVSHLRSYMDDAQGILGQEINSRILLPAPRAVKPYETHYIPKRDARFSDLYNSVLTADEVFQDREKENKERTWALMYKRLREMDVPEMMCSIVGQTKGKPWEYYLDMGRQIFDEVRHSMMGEVAFEQHGVDWSKLPIRINFSLELNTMLTPEERHALLYAIEVGLMPGDTGKKHEWEVNRKAGYELGTTFHDHDWADEVLHAQIGRKWIVPQLGGNAQTMELADRAREKIIAQRPDYVNEDANWWNRFYEQVKEKPFE